MQCEWGKDLIKRGKDLKRLKRKINREEITLVAYDDSRGVGRRVVDSALHEVQKTEFETRSPRKVDKCLKRYTATFVK